MRWNLSSTRRAARPGCACILVVLLVAAAGPALAQPQAPGVVIDLGRIELGRLSALMPSMVYRPIDVLSVRPGGDALGMGGAYIASASGAIALGWNPAGMADLERTSWACDGYSLSTGSSVGSFPRGIEIPGAQLYAITGYQLNLRGGFRPNFLAVGTPLWSSGERRLVAAFGWRHYAEMGMPEQVVSNLSAGAGQTSVPLVISLDRSERGGLEAFSPALAFRLGSSLSLGGTVNILGGGLRANVDQRLTVAGYPLRGAASLKSRYSGLSPELGGRANLGPRVSVGLRFTPAYTLQMRDGTFFSRSFPNPENGGGVTIINATIADYDLKVPAAFGAGVAFRPLPRLLLAADMNSQSWSKATVEYRKHLLQPGEQPLPDSVGLPLADVRTVHFGAEYKLFRSSWGEVPVRVGFRTTALGFLDLADSAAVQNISSNPDNPEVTGTGIYLGKQPKGHAFSFGASLVTPGIRYDLGFESTSYELHKWFFETPLMPILNPETRNPDGTGTGHGSMVTTKQTVSKIRLSATCSF
jgi:hypothetical protein